MAYRDFELPDGTFVKVPENDTFEEADAWARQKFPDAYAGSTQGAKQKEGFVANVKEGAKRYVDTSGAGIGALFDPSGAKQRAQESLAQPQDTKAVTWQDVKDKGIGQLPGFARDTLAGTLPQMGATIAGAKVGSMAGAPLGPVGALVGAGLGGIAANIPSFVGGNIERQVQAEPNAEVNIGAAGASAVGQSALDAIPMLGLLGKMGVGKLAGEGLDILMKKSAAEVQAKLVKSAQQSIMGATAKGAALGIAVEMPTEVAQAILERAQAGLSLFSPDALQEYEANAAGAVVIGAPLGGAGRLSDRSQGKQFVRGQEAQAQEAAAIEKRNTERQVEEDKKKPEYLLDLDARYQAVQSRIKEMQGQITAIGKVEKNTSEDARKKELGRELGEFIKENRDVINEHGSKRAGISAAKERARVAGMTPEDYMLEGLGVKPPKTVEATGPATMEEAALEGQATPTEQVDPAQARANEVTAAVLSPYGGIAIPGTEADIAEALMQDPALAQSVVNDKIEFPGLNRQQNSAVRDALKLQLKEQERTAAEMAKGRDKAERERTKEDVADADLQRSLREADDVLSTLATKPTTPTGLIPGATEAAAVAAEPGTEPSMPDAKRVEIETARDAYQDILNEYLFYRKYNRPQAVDLRKRVIDARDKLDVAVNSAGNAMPQIVKQVTGEDTALVEGVGTKAPKLPERDQILADLEARIKEQDDIVKAGVNKRLDSKGTLTEDGRKVALAQSLRDDLVEQRKQLLADVQRPRQQAPNAINAQKLSDMIDAALAKPAGEDVTVTDTELERRAQKFADIRDSLLDKYSQLLGGQAIETTPASEQAVDQAKRELIAASIEEIKAQRALAGLVPLTIPDKALAAQISRKIYNEFTARSPKKRENQTTAKRSGDSPESQGLVDRISSTVLQLNDLSQRKEEGEPYLAPVINRLREEKNKLVQELERVRLAKDPYFRRDQEATSVIDRQINTVNARLNELTGRTGADQDNARGMGSMSAYARSNPEKRGEIERLQRALVNLRSRRERGFGGQEIGGILQNIINGFTIDKSNSQKTATRVKNAKSIGKPTRVRGADAFELGRQMLPPEPKQKVSKEDQALVQRMREQEITAINDAVQEGRIAGAEADKADRAIQQLLGRLEDPATQEDVARAKEMFGERDDATPDLFRDGLTEAMTRASENEQRVEGETKQAKSEAGKALAGMKGKSAIKDAVNRLAAKFGKAPDTETDYAAAKKRLEAARTKANELKKQLEEAKADAEGSRTAKLNEIENEANAQRIAMQKTLGQVQDQLKKRRDGDPVPETTPIYKAFLDKIVALRKKIDDDLRPRITKNESAAAPLQGEASVPRIIEANTKQDQYLQSRLNEIKRRIETKIAEMESAWKKSRAMNIAKREVSDIVDDVGFYERQTAEMQALKDDLEAYQKAEKALNAPIRAKIKEAQEEIDALKAELKEAGAAYGAAVGKVPERARNVPGVIVALQNLSKKANEIADNQVALDAEADAPTTPASIEKYKALIAARKELQKEYKALTKDLGQAIFAAGKGSTVHARAQKTYEEAIVRQERSDKQYNAAQEKLNKIQSAPLTAVKHSDGTVRAGVRRVGGKTEEIVTAEQVKQQREEEAAERKSLLQEEVEGKKKRLEKDVADTAETVARLKRGIDLGGNDALAAQLKQAEYEATGARRRLGEFKGTLRKPIKPATNTSFMPPFNVERELIEKDNARALELRRKDELTEADKTELRRIEGRRATREAEALRAKTDKERAKQKKEEAAVQKEVTKSEEVLEKARTKVDAEKWEEGDSFFSGDKPLPTLTVAQIKESKKHPVNDKGYVEATDWLISRLKDPLKKALAQRVRQALSNVPGKVTFSTEYDETGPGNYNVDQQVVTLSPRLIGSNTTLEETLLHELTHAATVAGLQLDGDLRKQVYALMQRVKAWSRTEAGKAYLAENPDALTEGELYGLTDVFEFTAETFASPQFQKLLKQIPSGEQKTLFSRFVEFIAKLFGAKSPREMGVLAEAIDLTEKAMLSNWIAYETGTGDLEGNFAAKRQYTDAALGSAAETMIGKRTGTLAAIREQATGLGIRTRFIDNYAGLKEALKKGDYSYALQVSYDLMTFAQRNHLVQQAVMVGAPVREKWGEKNGRDVWKTEARGGANLKNVSAHLSKVKGFGNQQATNDAFTLLTLGMRAKTRGWDTVFGDTPLLDIRKDASLSERRTLEEKNNKIVEENKRKAEARAEADKLAAQYEKGDSPFSDAYKEYQDFNKSMLKFAMQAGVISEDAYRTLSREGNYTPLFRKDKNNNLVLDIGAGRDITVGKLADEAHLNKLLGDSSQVLDFFTAAVRNVSILVDQSLHNIASREAAFALQAMGAAKRIGKNEKSANVIEFRMKGQEDLQRFEIDTEAVGVPTDMVVKGFAGVPASLPGWVRLMGMPATFLRRAVTRNPLYMMRQLVRDPMSAWLTTGADFAPVSGTFKEVGKALSGMSDKTLDRRGLTGGMMFAEDDVDIDRIQKEAQSLPGWSVGYVVSKLDDAALAADAVTRRNVYQAALKQGASEIEATLAAYEAMPFSKRGTSPSMRYLNHMVPFLSATIQGWDVLYRSIKGDMPLNERVDVRNQLLLRGAMIAGMTMLYAMAMEDDETYKNANTVERLNNWFIPIPGGATIKLPVPFELGIIFKMLPEALVRGASEDKELGKELINVGKAAVGMVPNIMGGHATLPIFETLLNKSLYTGNPIEGRGLEAVDIGQRYDKNTSELSKLLGFDVEVFGTQVGISPKKLEYMLGAYSAGLYPAMAALIDTVLPAPSAEKPDRKLSELPVFKSALQQEDAGGRLNKFYEEAENLARYNATFKKLLESDPTKAQEYAQENSVKMGKGAAATKMRAAIDKFNELENIIRNNPQLSGAQKQKAIENVKSLRTKLASQFSSALAA